MTPEQVFENVTNALDDAEGMDFDPHQYLGLMARVAEEAEKRRRTYAYSLAANDPTSRPKP